MRSILQTGTRRRRTKALCKFRYGLLFGTIFHAAMCAARVGVVAAEADAQWPRREASVLAGFDVEQGGGPLIISVVTELKSADNDMREVNMRMLVDTGVTYTIYDKRHRAVLGRSIGTGVGFTVTGRVAMERFNAPTIRIGRIRINTSERIFCGDLQPVMAAFGERIDGLLGMDVLRYCKFSVDFDAGKLRFHKTVGADAGGRVPLVWDDRVTSNCPIIRGQLPDGAVESF